MRRISGRSWMRTRIININLLYSCFVSVWSRSLTTIYYTVKTKCRESVSSLLRDVGILFLYKFPIMSFPASLSDIIKKAIFLFYLETGKYALIMVVLLCLQLIKVNPRKHWGRINAWQRNSCLYAKNIILLHYNTTPVSYTHLRSERN